MTLKSSIKISVILIFVCMIGFILRLALYRHSIIDNYSNVEYCYYYDTEVHSVEEHLESDNECYLKMYSLLMTKLLTYKAIQNGQEITIKPTGENYDVPENIINQVDAVISYGIADDWLFEYEISDVFKKPTYAYDCGIKKSEINNSNFVFGSECIGTDEFLMYKQSSSGNIHTFGQKLKELNLEDKKIYLKIGIPENHRVMKDILKYKDNILGISIVIDLWSPKYIIDTINMIDLINKDFVLVSRKNLILKDVFKVKNTKGYWPYHISLTFVNKKVIDNYSCSFNQESNNYVPDTEQKKDKKFGKSSINYIVVLYEKIRKIKYNKIN